METAMASPQQNKGRSPHKGSLPPSVSKGKGKNNNAQLVDTNDKLESTPIKTRGKTAMKARSKSLPKTRSNASNDFKTNSGKSQKRQSSSRVNKSSEITSDQRNTEKVLPQRQLDQFNDQFGNFLAPQESDQPTQTGSNVDEDPQVTHDGIVVGVSANEDDFREESDSGGSEVLTSDDESETRNSNRGRSRSKSRGRSRSGSRPRSTNRNRSWSRGSSSDDD